LYPEGIPIHAESELAALIAAHGVDEVVFAYSDVTHTHVMTCAARAAAAGADFRLLAPLRTMIGANKPVIAVCAVRTGCGKSQTSRAVAANLRDMGLRVAVIRHPMPYGDLSKQACQRFASAADLVRHDCTIEEREEYEPHLAAGSVVFAGVDYEQIGAAAAAECDVILWDGGNNDTPFYRPDLWITVADPHRAGHELSYYPGNTNFLMADVIVINKCDTAAESDIARIERNAASLNPNARVLRAASPITVDDAERIAGRSVLLVEDGPTLTHGDMTFGAAHVAARRFGASELVDPRPYAQGSLIQVFQKFPHLTRILPAMGYGRMQIRDLERTINQTPCDLVLIGTPIDLGRLLSLNKPALRVYYELAVEPADGLERIIRNTISDGSRVGDKTVHAVSTSS
jgi:predicted GTPase